MYICECQVLTLYKLFTPQFIYIYIYIYINILVHHSITIISFDYTYKLIYLISSGHSMLPNTNTYTNMSITNFIPTNYY